MGKSQCGVNVSKEAGSGRGDAKAREVGRWCIDQSWSALNSSSIFDEMIMMFNTLSNEMIKLD